MMNKKKLTTSVLALTTAAALALGGTFAWQSISQSVLNESTDTINPGGRLHNDIAAVEGDPNATYNFIYVENFSGDEEDDGTVTGGEDIYARIRLEEYMELVMNYGVADMEIVKNIAGAKTLKNEGATDDSGNALTDASATRKDQFDYTYELHFFDEEKDNAADGYWTWQLGKAENAENYGGYMPTFNKNKDSLAVDQNGSYTAAIGGIIERDDNYDMDGENSVMGYQTYADGDTRSATAIYDNDGNDADELAALSAADLNDIIKNGDRSTKWNGDYANAVHLESETHTARTIPTTKGVISMAAWLELGAAEQGNYWVYDTDGWVYWSSAIKPGDATGPLLEGFALDHEMDDTWYYAINVVAQFVTADDLGKKDNTGFYDEDGWYDPSGLGEEKAAAFENAGGAPSENALKLLEKIGVQTRDEDEMPTLRMQSNADSSVRVSVQSGESIRLLDPDGNTPDAEYVSLSFYDSSTSSDELEYTYEDGILTIIDGDWTNDWGNRIGVNGYDNDNGAYTGTIFYGDDGKLTLSRDGEDSYEVDCTIAALNEGVTIWNPDGSSPEDVQVYSSNMSSVPDDAEGNYIYAEGILTITNENWIGKDIKVCGTGDDEGIGYVLVTAGEDCFFSVTDNDGDNTNNPTITKHPTYGWTVNYKGTAKKLTFAPADSGETGWTLSFSHGENYDSTEVDGITTITRSGETVATFEAAKGLLNMIPDMTLDDGFVLAEKDGERQKIVVDNITCEVIHSLEASILSNDINVTTLGAARVQIESLVYDGSDLHYNEDKWSDLTAVFYETGTKTDPVITVSGSDFYSYEDGAYWCFDFPLSKLPEGTTTYDLYFTYHDKANTTTKTPLTVTFKNETLLLKAGGNTINASSACGYLNVEGVADPWETLNSTEAVRNALRITVDDTQARISDNNLANDDASYVAYQVFKNISNAGVLYIDLADEQVKAVRMDIGCTSTVTVKLTLNETEYSVTVNKAST